jgi:hypothetical protein
MEVLCLPSEHESVAFCITSFYKQTSLCCTPPLTPPLRCLSAPYSPPLHLTSFAAATAASHDSITSRPLLGGTPGACKWMSSKGGCVDAHSVC